MNWIVAAGAITLGALVGWMCGKTFMPNRTPTAAFLSAIVGVMVGSGIVGLFQAMEGKGGAGLPQEVWLFPAGLLTGFVFSAFQQIRDEKLVTAKDQIINFIENRRDKRTGQKDFEMVSEDTLKESCTGLSDDILRSVIKKYPESLARSKLQGGIPAIKLLPGADRRKGKPANQTAVPRDASARSPE